MTARLAFQQFKENIKEILLPEVAKIFRLVPNFEQFKDEAGKKIFLDKEGNEYPIHVYPSVSKVYEALPPSLILDLCITRQETENKSF